MATETVIIITGAVANLVAIGIAIYKLGSAISKFETIGLKQAEEISELKTAVKEIGRLITEMALSQLRQDEFDKRLNSVMKNVDDMRRGDGFIVPVR